ncbi:hypothetical protein E4S40_04565 [Algoriphagus kandeliae]|uniref:DUF5689 domain-containing protein n=1 Tax=Algoriphagus kandeliae TaxID=2562278 RepID=A0A4Y9QSW0_9BACT|nr:hypothetical protein [Algoriphagus kandeliae]TFV95499.1 hypothetical protein E4S40_04565 [Algoriphagus kandeliae]
MKSTSSIFRIFLFLATLSFLGSCDKDSDTPITEPDLSAIEESLEVMQITEDMDYFTLTILQSIGINGRLMDDPFEKICAGVSVDVNSDQKTITIDFGDGCTSPSGIVRKGKITITYTQNFLLPGATVTTNFIGYEVNGLKITGVRTLVNQAIDLINNQVTLKVTMENGQVTWPDNTFVTFNTDQIRVVKLGATGYEISITGTANGQSREGAPYSSNVTSALVVKQDCVESGVLIPTSGVMDFTYEGFQLAIDYGQGNCDKTILISYPGGTKEITVD